CSSGDFAVSNEGIEDGSIADSSGGTVDTGGTTTDSGGTSSDSGGATEVGMGETSVLDVGTGDADAGMCPRPASTKTFDVSAYGCDKLGTAYAEALDAAKVCNCDADCSTTLPDNFCNNCKSFVSPGNDGYRAAQAILAEFQKRVMAGTCPALACPGIICPDPVAAGCHGSGAGTVRTCRKAG
ncbi:MAG: hypothetical protein ACXWP4_19210, partial [Polyangiales bacterium]